MILPTVIEKKKVVKVGGEALSVQRNVVGLDVKRQTVADIQNLIKLITAEEVENQERLGNPATALAVDNSTTKSIKDVQRKTEVAFGNLLQVAAMRMIEMTLATNIKKATASKSGKLSNMSNWEWLLVTPTETRIVTKSTLPTMGIDDRVILRPKLKYAGLVNSLVAQSSLKSGFSRTTRKNNPKKKIRGRKMGFMGATSQSVKRSRFLKLFSVYAGTTKAFMIPGEYMTDIGSPCIIVRPRRGRFNIRRV